MESFHVHDGADCHKEAKLKLCSVAAPSITQQMSKAAAKNAAENRCMLLKTISSLRFLLRQGLAIRVHKEEEGNLFQLLSLRIEVDPRLAKWLKEKNYLSHDITNEIITLLGNNLLREILRNIREATWFSIQAETFQIMSSYQCPFAGLARHEIHEDFIRLVHVPNITSSMLTSAIKDVLIRCALPLTQCRGQSYDDDANMMGHLNVKYNHKRKERFQFSALPIA